MEGHVDEAPEAIHNAETDIALELPSIKKDKILAGESYTYFSPIPNSISTAPSTECVLGIDEAGRGPVIGPMVYGVFYVPVAMEKTLLVDTHHFDDSKVLTPSVRSSLMETVCSEGTDLFANCGWAVSALSPRAISSGMLKPAGTGVINLNVQAINATVELIKGVLERKINVTHVYVDTIGQPAAYQRKLEQIFPTLRFTVAKKADSLYPCVSAASVCAKVTRDVALEVNFDAFAEQEAGREVGSATNHWGSGYPSDARCAAWLKRNLDPVFGWGSECRFSWGTVKDILEGNDAIRFEWAEGEEASNHVTNYFANGTASSTVPERKSPLATWYGETVDPHIF